MERKGGQIIHSVEEQVEFNVPRRVTVDMALETAEVFINNAKHLEDEVSDTADEVDKTTAHLNTQRSYNVGRLTRYANLVFELCPDKHLERITAVQQATK